MAGLPIALITFDLDDTLWDLRPVLVRAEAILYRWLEQHCPSLTKRYSTAQLREQRMQLARDRPELGHRVSALRLHSLEWALRDSGFAPAQAQVLAAEAFAVFLRERHAVELFEQADAVLGELAENYRLGVITNGNFDVATVGLDRFFSIVIKAEHLERPKPHPEPFLAALAAAGVAPSQCIHIGDHVDHDIRGAQDLGIHTIWMNPAATTWPGGPPPSAEIQHLAQLPMVVRRISVAASAPVS